MPGVFTIQVIPSPDMVQPVCALCNTLFDLALSAVVLYQDEQPLGFLCKRCLTVGPRQAAPEARRRASELRASIHGVFTQIPSGSWATVAQRLHERAEHWESLADEMEKLDEWFPCQSGKS